MASREELEAALSSLPAQVWDDPRDLNRMSLEGLFGTGGARVLHSSGSIRLHGVSVSNHAARLDATAEVLSHLQRLVTAMGAAKRGIRTSQGPLPGELVTLTQLKIAAAPVAGSLIFDLVPETLPETELLEDGNVAIFDQAQRQFVDECFEDAIRLVLIAHSIDPDADRLAVAEGPSEVRPAAPTFVEGFEPVDGPYPSDAESLDGRDTAAILSTVEGGDLTEVLIPSGLDAAEAHTFIQQVREGGPRLATAVRTFAKAVESADFDVDLEWREPNKATLRAQFTRHDARLVRRLVVSRDLEVELQDLVGRLITLSTTKAWQLAVGQDAVLTVDASKLEHSVRSALHLEEQVTIRARAIQRSLPGGGTSTTFEAVSVTSMEHS